MQSPFLLLAFLFPVFLSSVLLLPVTARCQNSPPDCSGLRVGVYYSYPKNTHGRYTFLRDGGTEKEFNLDTGDSTLWQVQWQGGCRYTLQFLSGNDAITSGQQQFLQKHKMAFQVEKITADYYIYAAYVDKVSHLFVQRDTVWLHEKLRVTDNELFAFISSATALRLAHFGDTSRFAVVYLYRPGKLTNSLSDFPVYGNDILLWMAHNKSGCLIKVLREGPLELKSHMFKDESAVQLDVHFGQVYFVKAMVHWGISSRLYNFKLEMATVPPDQGQTEFGEVNVR